MNFIPYILSWEGKQMLSCLTFRKALRIYLIGPKIETETEQIVFEIEMETEQ